MVEFGQHDGEGFSWSSVDVDGVSPETVEAAATEFVADNGYSPDDTRPVEAILTADYDDF